ncbi:MAG: Stk1 family PASTA domain-containing Ser/Thr kinase [Acidimicrobiales bacterium]
MDTVSDRAYGSRYEPIEKIARGGMADVYRARDTLLDRPVALKVLFPELSVNDAFVERFRREAQAAANLSQSNIVSVFDWGRDHGTYFIVMELVTGSTLAQRIRAAAPLPVAEVASVGADVAGALAFAHRHGVVHRDIKPSNVLITTEGDVKVADFGIARAVTSEGDLTQTGSVLGTASYISPEQAQGGSLDGRSDVYSLGIVMYEMATGVPPFTGDSPLAIAFKHVKDPLPLPSSIEPSIPSDLEAVIVRCLAKDPNDRYGTASALRADLLRFSQGRAVEAAILADRTAVRVPPQYRDLAADPTVAIPLNTTEEPTKGSRRGWIVALVVAVIVAAIAGFVLVGSATGLFSTATATTAAPQLVSVPSVTGLSQSSAIHNLNRLGLKHQVHSVRNSAKSGTVVGQNPQSGTSLKKGSSVTLTVSSGPSLVSVPKVTQENISVAENTLLSLGFNVTTNYVSNSKASSGTVIAQSPPSGTSQPARSTITLTVSNGPTTVQVPNVVGDLISQAANTLSSNHLTVGTVTSKASSQPANTVLSQSPAAQGLVPVNTSVNLVISSGTSSTTTSTTQPTTTSTTTSTTQPTTTSTTTSTTQPGPPGG